MGRHDVSLRARTRNRRGRRRPLLDPAVLEEMLPFLTKYFGNPSSGYGFGAQVRSAVDLARARVAALLGCEHGEIVFTSCGTESNNAAVNSALQLDPARQHIVTTAMPRGMRRVFADLGTPLETLARERGFRISEHALYLYAECTRINCPYRTNAAHPAATEPP